MRKRWRSRRKSTSSARLFRRMLSSYFDSRRSMPTITRMALAKAIRHVLENAEKQILKADPERIRGEFRDFLQVHQSRKKETPKGEKILVKDGTRKTYYTEEQELY